MLELLVLHGHTERADITRNQLPGVYVYLRVWV